MSTFTNWITPSTRSFERSGTQMTDRVSHFVVSSTRLANSGSALTSGTTRASPFFATHPAIPSPTFRRTFFSASALSPTAIAK